MLAELAGDADSRVVEHEVEPPVLGGHPVDETLHAVVIGDVEDRGGGGASGRRRHASGDVVHLRVDVREDDGRAATRELLRQRAADSRRGAGDDRDRAVEDPEPRRGHARARRHAWKRTAAFARRFAASISRSRAGALVTSDASSSRAALVT